ncbi:MAG: transposase [Patescibacteria group bacterium]|nr:transposase [Patescibacteria group bacterium]
MIAAEDESIFKYEVTVKRFWAAKGSKPRIPQTGSRLKTCVYGTIVEDGNQFFRQYDKCNSAFFLNYLEKLCKKCPKLILLIDRAKYHQAKKVLKFFSEHKHQLHIIWLPTGWPELNPAEEAWKLGKQDDRVGRKLHDNFTAFKQAISVYYRTQRFKLGVDTYLF